MDEELSGRSIVASIWSSSGALKAAGRLSWPGAGEIWTLCRAASGSRRRIAVRSYLEDMSQAITSVNECDVNS